MRQVVTKKDIQRAAWLTESDTLSMPIPPTKPSPSVNTGDYWDLDWLYEPVPFWSALFAIIPLAIIAVLK